jgi:hypothetical protein
LSWYLNRALSTMRAEIDARYPHRDRGSDGTIGDEAHQSRGSDHNEDPDGSVDAWDMDVEVNGKGNPYAADVEFLKRRFEQHPAAGYWIHNDQIASRSDGWRRRSYAYAGPNRNRHTKHVHFNTRESHETSAQPWGIALDEGTDQMFCKFADRGDTVRHLQYRLHNLGFPVQSIDGAYGAKTAAALAAAIKAHNGAVIDGKTYGPAQMIYLDVMWARKYGSTRPGPAGPPGPPGPQGPAGAPGQVDYEQLVTVLLARLAGGPA